MKVFDPYDYSMLGQLLVLASEFADETDHRLSFNNEIAAERFVACGADENQDVICCTIEDELAGIAIVAVDTDFINETWGYIVKFYVRQKYRRSGVGRGLLASVEEWFDKKDALYRWATATAGVGQDQAFINLFKKFGYEDGGKTLVRRI